MFSRVGVKAFKADLSNTIRLCKELNNPQEKIKTIHIAGTNGKGSVSHMLAAILQTSGYNTGLYTSPHLKDFRERIKINGEMIPEQFVIDFTEKLKPLIEEIEPSFFEITVAMAFDYFATQKVDIAVIETGLGGRLDSTNIITPLLSIITNIGFDHMNLLGNTLEEIAFEKAGIIKNDIPVVIGETLPETKPIFDNIAAQKKAPITFASLKRQASDWLWVKNYLTVEVSEQHKPDHKTYQLDLPGIYQAKNLLTVLEACTLLKQSGWKIEEPSIKNALFSVKKLTGLHGRWDVIHFSPKVVLDVAHNTDGIKQLIQQVEVTEHKTLHIIIGMVKDKEIEKILSLLPEKAIYYFTKAHIPRALSEEELSLKGKKAGLKGKKFTEVNLALKAALDEADADDLIIVCGSVFLVGEVIPVDKIP